MKIYLSLGTNLGNRKDNIEKALCCLEKSLGSAPCSISSMIETESWGFEGPDFLNCVVCFDWKRSLGPRRLLKICKVIEHKMGRKEVLEYDEAGRRIYHSRVIDIDILFYGTKRIDSLDLTIPHPLIACRAFVLGPLNEIVEEPIKNAFPEIFQTK